MLHMAFCDDDPTILEQLERLVAQYRDSRGMEISCTAFNSPLELLAEIAKGLWPDVLFLDMIMPGENGITAAREIRQYDRNVKIIFLTSSSEFAVESYTVGAYYYQIKPIWPDSFCRLLDAVVDTCRREAEHSLILRCKTGVARIELEQLEYCEVIGRTLMFHMAGAVAHHRGADGLSVLPAAALDRAADRGAAPQRRRHAKYRGADRNAAAAVGAAALCGARRAQRLPFSQDHAVGVWCNPRAWLRL